MVWKLAGIIRLAGDASRGMMGNKDIIECKSPQWREEDRLRKQDCLLPFSIIWIQLCLKMMGNWWFLYMHVPRLSTKDNNRIWKSSSRREERWAECENHLGWVRVHDNQMEDLQDVVSINWQNCCAEWHPSSLAALMKSELTIWIMITPSEHRGCMANHVCSLGDTPIIRLPAVSKLRVGLQYSNKNEPKCDLTKKSAFNRCKTRYDLQGTRCQIKNTYEVWRWTLTIVETSVFLPLVCPKGSENVAFFTPQVFNAHLSTKLWSVLFSNAAECACVRCTAGWWVALQRWSASADYGLGVWNSFNPESLSTSQWLAASLSTVYNTH